LNLAALSGCECAGVSENVVLEIADNLYFIATGSTYGWVKRAATTVR
jgi:hypothetical protein